MPTIVQLRRGTTSQNDAFTGTLGELIVDTTLNNLRVHDGSTAGGHLVTGGMQTGGDIASASPLVIGTDGDSFDVTGTTSFAAMTVTANRHLFTQFDGVLTMTHGGSLVLPGAANITTAAGDIAEWISTAANTVRCVNYTKADGTAVASAVAANRRDCVASGSLVSGNVVALNTDGTVSAVAEDPAAIGTEVVANTAYDNMCRNTVLSSTKGVIVYYGAGAFYCKVATVTGSSISFGAATSWASGISNPEIEALTSTQFVIAFTDDSNANKGKAIVGTISGTTVSFGTIVQYEAGQSRDPSLCKLTDTKVVIAYCDMSNSSYGTAIVGTISGSSISFGSSVVFSSSNSSHHEAVSRLSDTKVLIAFNDTPATDGTAVVGTISGTSISYGTKVVYSSGRAFYNVITSISETQALICYRAMVSPSSSSDPGVSVIATIDGTTITYGSDVTFIAATSGTVIDSMVLVSPDQVLVGFRDNADNYGKTVIGTISGTTVSYASPVTFNSASTVTTSVSLLATGKIFITFGDGGNSGYPTGVIYTLASSNADEWIGITESTVSDAATATIAFLAAIVSNQTSLTINSTYYVDEDGSLTVSTTSGRKLGRALSTTELLIEGNA